MQLKVGYTSKFHNMKYKKIGFLCLLFAVSLVFLFANFLHTETTLEEKDDCPICRWEGSSIALSEICFLLVSIFFVSIFKLGAFHQKAISLFDYRHFSIRGPPPFQALDG
jgi:hypothetical protein